MQDVHKPTFQLRETPVDGTRYEDPIILICIIENAQLEVKDVFLKFRKLDFLPYLGLYEIMATWK